MNQNHPKVSVIINSHNGAQYLKEAIDSVYTQTYPDWEIIVYDNYSSDKTHQIVEEYDEKLRYFRSNEFLNLGAARNEAVKCSRGEFVAFLDSDDVWLPAKLKKQLNLFDESRVGIVYANAIYFVEGARHGFLLYKKKSYLPKGYIFRDLLKVNHLCLSTVLVRRKCLENIEWFPEGMNLAEEYDLFLRISYSWKANYIFDPLVWYRIHDRCWSITGHSVMPKEMKNIQDRLILLLPDLEEKYKPELLHFKSSIKKAEAVALWSNNKRRQARDIFLGLFKETGEIKMLMLFLVSLIISFGKYSLLKNIIKEKISSAVNVHISR